jgi:hypothetical protein
MNLETSPTADQLRDLLAQCNDRAGSHVLWATRSGDLAVTRLEKRSSVSAFEQAHPEMQARFATFLPGNEYVGPDAAADEDWVKELFDRLVRAWPKAKGRPEVVHLDLY